MHDYPPQLHPVITTTRDEPYEKTRPILQCFFSLSCFPIFFSLLLHLLYNHLVYDMCSPSTPFSHIPLDTSFFWTLYPNCFRRY
jgi:hypothetical protein